MAWLERALDALQWVAERIVIGTFSVMVLAILATVLTRNVSVSITWFEELARFMQIWFVGLGLALALRRGMMSGAEIVVAALPERLARVLVLAAKLVIVAVSLAALVSGADLLAHLARSGQAASNIRIPIVWVYLGLWLGFALALTFVLGSLALQLAGRDDLFARSYANILPPVEASPGAEEAAVLSEVAGAGNSSVRPVGDGAVAEPAGGSRP